MLVFLSGPYKRDIVFIFEIYNIYWKVTKFYLGQKIINAKNNLKIVLYKKEKIKLKKESSI